MQSNESEKGKIQKKKLACFGMKYVHTLYNEVS